jgi:N-acetylmuramate 1-kinase
MDADGVDLGPALSRLYGAANAPLRLTKLKGHASTRSYYRLEWAGAEPPLRGPRSLVAMRLPADSLASDEADAAARSTELPFVDVQRMLAARGVPVPLIYIDDTQNRVLLLEDLGDETFEARLQRTPSSRWHELYGEAIELLAGMHRACENGRADESIAFRRGFDRELLRWELDHFRQWGLEALVGALPSAERSALDREFDRLADELIGLPHGFVHRDYQSRNLMWTRGGEQLTVIDFQDALRGPAVYDLVALLCDSYVALPQSLQQAMIERYAREMGLDGRTSERLEAGFWLVAVQRKLKDAGRFVFIDRERGNPDFLRFYPQSLRYVGRALHITGRNDLLQLLAKRLPGFPDEAAIPAAVSSAKG